MNREMKFRGWSFDDKSWMNPATIEVWDKTGILKAFYGGDYVIEQFTGLKDKNGKEIYEGDIINFAVHGAAHGREREDYINQEVWFTEEDGCWAFGRNTVPDRMAPKGILEGTILKGYDWYHSMLDEIDRNSIEIVGNIHEK